MKAVTQKQQQLGVEISISALSPTWAGREPPDHLLPRQQYLREAREIEALNAKTAHLARVELLSLSIFQKTAEDNVCLFPLHATQAQSPGEGTQCPDTVIFYGVLSHLWNRGLNDDAPVEQEREAAKPQAGQLHNRAIAHGCLSALLLFFLLGGWGTGVLVLEKEAPAIASCSKR